MKYVVVGDPIPPEFTTAAGINRVLATISELRAVLAPLLDGPYYAGLDGDACVFCLAHDGGSIPHDVDCPVLRRDELLGRTSTTTENSVDSQ